MFKPTESRKRTERKRIAPWQWGLLFLLAILGAWGAKGLAKNGHLAVSPLRLPESLVRMGSQMGKVNRAFGFDRTVIVALEAPPKQDALSKEMVALNQALTKEITRLDGIARVVSLASSLSIRMEQQTMVVRRLFPEKPEAYTAEVAKALRAQLKSDPLFRGSLLSPNQRIALVIAVLQENQDAKGRKRIIEGILKALEKTRGLAPDTQIGFVGMPAVEVLLQQDLQREAPWLYPMAIASFLFVLLCLLRSWSALLWWFLWSLGGGSAAWVALSWIFGGWHPAMGFVLLWWLWIGIAWAIDHAVTRRLARRDVVAARSYMRGLRLALMQASLIASAGSLAWAAWGWPIMSDLALASTVGILLLSASAWLLWPRPYETRRQEEREASLSQQRESKALALREEIAQSKTLREAQEKALSSDPLAAWMMRSASLWGMGIALLLALCLGGLGHLRYGAVLERYLPHGGYLWQGERMMREAFGGATPLIIRFRGDLRHPLVLKAIERLGRTLETQKGIAHPQSIAVLIRHLHSMMKGSPRIPDEREQISALWVLLEGQPALASLLRDQGRDGILQARLQLLDPLRQAALEQALQESLALLPRQAEAVKLATLSAEEKKSLFSQRLEWVWTGIQLWLQRHSGLLIDDRAKARLMPALQHVLEHAQDAYPPPRSLFKLKQALLHYLKSEGCDIEINPSQQQQAFDAVFAAFAKGTAPRPDALQAILAQSLHSSPAAKDRDGLRLAVKAILRIHRDLARNIERDALLRRVLRESARLPHFLQTPLGRTLQQGRQAASPRLSELSAEITELQNQRWYRLDRGKTLIHVESTGLHSLWFAMAKQAHSLLWPLLGAFFLMILLISFLLFRDLHDTLWLFFSLLATTFALLGLIGWFGFAFDLATLLFFFTSLFFAAFLLARLRLFGRLLRQQLQHDGFLHLPLMTTALSSTFQQLLLFLTPLAFLCFSVFPTLFALGCLFSLGTLLAFFTGLLGLLADATPPRSFSVSRHGDRAP